MYLIVGIDAGINTGYVLLDLNGHLVAAGVEKEASHERIVKIISDNGTPSIIATDVKSAPHFVRKIAARFNAPVFTPQKNISVDEKKQIAKGIVNAHMRDAYAAAVKAFRHYANRLRQIESKDEGTVKKEKLKHLVIRGTAVGKLKD